MGGGQHPTRPDERSSAQVTRSKVIAIVQGLPYAHLMPGGAQSGLRSVDDPPRIHIEAGLNGSGTQRSGSRGTWRRQGELQSNPRN